MRNSSPVHGTTDAEIQSKVIELDVTQPIWDHFFGVYPLVVIGTREADGGADLAPKHMAMPLGWEDYFGFVCTPSHATYANAKREGCFTVSFPRPDQIVVASLAAAPRQDDGAKPSLAALPVESAVKVSGVVLEGAYLHLECELDRIVDGFGRASLIVGRLVRAAIADDCIRDPEVDDAEMLRRSPLFAYVSPGRVASIGLTNAFPFHVGFRR